jgi:hypothetical protein
MYKPLLYNNFNILMTDAFELPLALARGLLNAICNKIIIPHLKMGAIQ